MPTGQEIGAPLSEQELKELPITFRCECAGDEGEWAGNADILTDLKNGYRFTCPDCGYRIREVRT